jgi:hypothetical protein
MTPAEDPASAPKVDAQGFIIEEVSHNGSIPDPESLNHWEKNDDDPNKISS